MFLTLSKVLDLAAAPLTWAVLLGVLAFAWQGRRPALARLLLAVGLLQLIAFSTELVSRGLFARLEAGARDTYQPDPPYDAVVVLGGMVEPAAQVTGQLEVNEAAERILRANDLLRDGRARVALLSGGLAFPRPGEVPEAELLARWLRSQGIPPERIVVEPRSRNTRENALEAASIIEAHGWKRVLLITSAWHAPRALGCFRALGLAPDLLGVDHRSGPMNPLAWIPRASALSASTDALREMLGRLVYRAMGYAR